MDLTKTKHYMDNYNIRRPTHCRDVTAVIMRIIVNRNNMCPVQGIIHYNNTKNMTKYDIGYFAREYLGLPINVFPYNNIDETRPSDTCLINNVHVFEEIDFYSAVKKILNPYTIPTITKSVFLIIGLEGTLLDTYSKHVESYKYAQKTYYKLSYDGNSISTSNTSSTGELYTILMEMQNQAIHDIKNDYFRKNYTSFSYIWDSNIILKYILDNNINHVIVCDDINIIDHYKKHDKLLSRLTNFVSRKDLENGIAKYYKKEDYMLAFDSTEPKVKTCLGITRRCFYMSETKSKDIDLDCYTMNTFKLLIH
jgi:hypothetical protein